MFLKNVLIFFRSRVAGGHVFENTLFVNLLCTVLLVTQYSSFECLICREREMWEKCQSTLSFYKFLKFRRVSTSISINKRFVYILYIYTIPIFAVATMEPVAQKLDGISIQQMTIFLTLVKLAVDRYYLKLTFVI